MDNFHSCRICRFDFVVLKMNKSHPPVRETGTYQLSIYVHYNN